MITITWSMSTIASTTNGSPTTFMFGSKHQPPHQQQHKFNNINNQFMIIYRYSRKERFKLMFCLYLLSLHKFCCVGYIISLHTLTNNNMLCCVLVGLVGFFLFFYYFSCNAWIFVCVFGIYEITVELSGLLFCTYMIV